MDSLTFLNLREPRSEFSQNLPGPPFLLNSAESETEVSSLSSADSPLLNKKSDLLSSSCIKSSKATREAYVQELKVHSPSPNNLRLRKVNSVFPSSPLPSPSKKRPKGNLFKQKCSQYGSPNKTTYIAAINESGFRPCKNKSVDKSKINTSHRRAKQSHVSSPTEATDEHRYYSPQKSHLNIQLSERQQECHKFQSKLVDDFSTSHWSAIRSIDIAQTIGKYPIQTFKKSYGHGLQLSYVYGDITQKILTYGPQSPHSDEDALELYCKLWVLFPSLFLRNNKASSISIIKHRLKQYRNLDWVILIADLKEDCQDRNPFFNNNKRKTYKGAIPVEERSPESRYVTAAVNFADKNISKAYDTIVNPSTASNSVSSKSIEVLRNLHPMRQDMNLIPEALLFAAKEIKVSPLSTPEKLWKIISNLKNGKAPGLDGLRSEHLVSMARHGKAKWISNMSSTVNFALASALPSWLNDTFAYSKLIGLVKPSEDMNKLKNSSNWNRHGMAQSDQQNNSKSLSAQSNRVF